MATAVMVQRALGGGTQQDGDAAVFRAKHRTEDLLGGFHDYTVAELGRAQTTADSYVKALLCLERWVDKPLCKVDSDDLRRFKREARDQYAGTSIQQVVVAMRQFHKWGALEGHWPLNGIAAVPTPRRTMIPKPPLAFSAAIALMSACHSSLHFRVVFLGLYAGLRIAESASVTEREWFGDRLTIIGKGSKQRQVPVHPELAKVRPIILESKPATTAVLLSAMQRLRNKARVCDIQGNPASSHSLRRTFADALYDKFAVPQEVVGAILGHGKKVTEFYAPVRFDRMREAVDLLDYSYGSPVQLSLFGADSVYGTPT